ncbi:uncharacterized protein LOC102809047 [Saccoglossus kowalevskii]
MLFCLALISLLCHARAQLPPATNYLGVGYNLVQGNPEGSLFLNGGLDPGLLGNKQIFELTYTLDPFIPDQAEVYYPGNCTDSFHKDIFWGTLSYQNILNEFVARNDTLVFLVGYEYVQSDGYVEVDQSSNVQGHVYFDERQKTYCGYARYKTEEADAKQYPVSTGFAAAVCALSPTYNEEEYMDFIDTWGTHVVVEVTYGSRVTKRHKDECPDFVAYAAGESPSSIQQGGPYLSWPESLIVDMHDFVANSDSTTEFGSEKGVFETGGGDALTEPIGLVLITVAEAADLTYWRRFCNYVVDGFCELEDLVDMPNRRAFIETALQNYANYKGLESSSNPIVQTPLTWPEGSYGIPDTTSDCPLAPDFVWETGARFQDTENSGTGNDWSTPYNLKGPYFQNDMQQNFCMKTLATSTQYDWSWGEGEYCIYRKGVCPANFFGGYVSWDDEDDTPQNNNLTGTLPDGVYDRNTLIYFCCREDGSANRPIYLPTDQPFALIKRTASCQQVANMTYSEEWFKWDNEDTFNEDEVFGFGPYNTGGVSEHQLHYCVYF